MHRIAWGLVSLVLAASSFAAPDAFKDPLDVSAPTLMRRLVSTHTNAVTRAGDRLVAVGIGGLVLVSDDGGEQWTQASVPVSSDLTDVHFPTPTDGWAVGHDGVVLRTRDGGRTWHRQFDGRAARKLLIDHFQPLADAGDADAARHLRDVELNYASGPEQALLGVWFRDAQHGFVCGSFGTLFATDDGGLTWKSWVERVEVDTPPHFYAIRGTRRGVLMASEKGIVFRLDPATDRFVALHTGYAGTFFNLLELDGAVLAMGLRGNVYRLAGDGDAWKKVSTAVTSSVTSGTRLHDGSALLATQMGQLLLTRDGGKSFDLVPADKPMSYTGLAMATPKTAVAAGLGGVRVIPLQ